MIHERSVGEGVLGSIKGKNIFLGREKIFPRQGENFSWAGRKFFLVGEKFCARMGVGAVLCDVNEFHNVSKQSHCM